MPMQLTSPSFADGAEIPARFTRDGDNRHPPLRWTGVPADAKALAILLEDPDAPSGTFVHWVVSGLDPDTNGLAEGEVPGGAVEGRNDFGEIGYGGPQPPPGDEPHRYVFSLLALRSGLELGAGSSIDELRAEAASERLARCELIGRFGR